MLDQSQIFQAQGEAQPKGILMVGFEFLRQKKDRLLEFFFKNSQKKILESIEQNDLPSLKKYFYTYKYSFAFLNKTNDTLLHIIARNNLAKFKRPVIEKKNDLRRTNTNETPNYKASNLSEDEKSLDEKIDNESDQRVESASEDYERELETQKDIVRSIVYLHRQWCQADCNRSSK